MNKYFVNKGELFRVNPNLDEYELDVLRKNFLFYTEEEACKAFGKKAIEELNEYGTAIMSEELKIAGRTASQTLKAYIEHLAEDACKNYASDLKEEDETVDEWLYDEWLYKDIYHDLSQELRQGEIETDIECLYSRYYSSRSVAMYIKDFEGFSGWIGWTYWYGGGKHANPEDVPWIKDAYFLDVEEKEVLQIVRSFSKKH